MDIKFENIGWLFRSSKGIRLKGVLNVVLGVTQIALDLSFIWASKMCVDVATGNGEMAFRWAVVALIGTVVGSILLSYCRNWVGAILGTKSQNLMQLRTFSMLMRNIWTGRESMHSGDSMNRLLIDSRQITSVMTDTVPSMVCTMVRLGCAFAFVYSMQPELSLLMVSIVPFFLLLSAFYVRKMKRLSKDIRETESRIQVALQENLQNKMVIKTLGQAENMVQSVSDIQNVRLDKVRNKTKFSSVTNMITSIGFATGYLVTFIWSANGLMHGTITYGMMVAFVQLVGQIQGPFRSMTYLLPQVIGALVSVDRMRELEETPVEDESENRYMEGCVGVRLDDVDFTYTDGDLPVLQHFSHDFQPGSFTAVLGGTGSGKTTMLRLLLALTRPTRGRVVLYNNVMEEDVTSATRCNMVYVPQGNTLLSGTVRDNLLLGDPTATDEEMREMLRLTCADFVLQHGEELNLSIGEDGLGLSEGQAQRICIARSLLHRGGVLLLDEVTSALDVETEKRIVENITERAAKLGQTVIFVTHRRKVLEYCDNVLHVENLSEKQ